MKVFRSIILLPFLFFYVALCTIFFLVTFLINQTLKFLKK